MIGSRTPHPAAGSDAAWPPRRALPRRFRRDQDGATAVEFTLLALPFLFFLFATIEIALLFMGDLMLDSAVDTVGRQVRTGQLDRSDMTKETFREIVCGNVTGLIDCSKLRIDLRAYDTFAAIDPKPPVMGSERFEKGGPYQIMALRVYYDWPLLSAMVREAAGGSGTQLLAGVAAFRTEVYR